jgi:hypothetical protein
MAEHPEFLPYPSFKSPGGTQQSTDSSTSEPAQDTTVRPQSDDQTFPPAEPDFDHHPKPARSCEEIP